MTLKPTHNVHLKQWQLYRSALTAWDVILYEVQDADPGIADVVEHQHHAQLIAVGDSVQATYGRAVPGDTVRIDRRYRFVPISLPASPLASERGRCAS